MSYKKDREEFIARIVKELPTENMGDALRFARAILRNAATHGRLAVAQCNGDWPADNGERKVKECDECGSCYVPSSFRGGVCPDCNVERRIKKQCEQFSIVPIFQGDPRGCTVKLKLPSGYTDDWAKEGLCVPQRT